MLFSSIIELLSEKFTLSDVQYLSDYDIADISIYSSETPELSKNVLYFCDARSLKGNKLRASVLYYGDSDERFSEPPAINCARISASQMGAIFEYLRCTLRTELDMQKDYFDSLCMMLEGRDLSTIMNKLSQKMNNFYAAIDVSGKVLAHSENFVVNYAVWMRSIERGYCVEELMNFIEKVRNENKSCSGVPFVIYCGMANKYIMCGRVVSKGKIIGYVFLLKDENYFDAWDKQLIPLLAKAVKDSILRTKGTSDIDAVKYNDFLLAAISGAPSTVSRRMITAGKLKFPTQMRAIVVQPRFWQGENFVANQIRPILLKELKNIPNAIYDNSLVAILPVDNNGDISADNMKKLNSIVAEKYIYIGISNAFNGPDNIQENVNQCRAALSFALRMPVQENIFFYSDYAFFDLLDSASNKTALKACVHPLLGKLEALDAQKKSDLYRTLCVYAQTGFDKNRTSDILGIHRNTVNYRIQQIEQDFNINLSDPKLIFPLMLSVEIDSFEKRKFITDINSALG